jgi:hypothetical protein
MEHCVGEIRPTRVAVGWSAERERRPRMSTQSGTGIDAAAVLDEFTETRWITVQRGSHPFPF